MYLPLDFLLQASRCKIASRFVGFGWCHRGLALCSRLSWGRAGSWGWSGISIQPTSPTRPITSNHSFNQFHPAVSCAVPQVCNHCVAQTFATLALLLWEERRQNPSTLLPLCPTWPWQGAWEPGLVIKENQETSYLLWRLLGADAGPKL